MQIVVIGGAGVLGQALLRAIVARGVLTRTDSVRAPVQRVISVDRKQAPRLFVESRVEYVRADPGVPRLLQTVMGKATDSVFHAWDSGAGASDSTPSLALVDSLRDLLEACHHQSSRPKVVLASSFAADGGPDRPPGALPPSQDGLTALVGELLVEEATRRGQIDGRALRLPIIAGAPGCGAFLGELLRTLSEGQPTRCPIPIEASLWLTSARNAAQALLHAHEVPSAARRGDAVLNAPARALSVGALLQATGSLSGRPIECPVVEQDPSLCEALAQRPHRVAFDTALTLGFENGPDAETIVRDLLAPPER